MRSYKIIFGLLILLFVGILIISNNLKDEKYYNKNYIIHGKAIKKYNNFFDSYKLPDNVEITNFDYYNATLISKNDSIYYLIDKKIVYKSRYSTNIKILNREYFLVCRENVNNELILSKSSIDTCKLYHYKNGNMISHNIQIDIDAMNYFMIGDTLAGCRNDSVYCYNKNKWKFSFYRYLGGLDILNQSFMNIGNNLLRIVVKKNQNCLIELYKSNNFSLPIKSTVFKSDIYEAHIFPEYIFGESNDIYLVFFGNYGPQFISYIFSFKDNKCIEFDNDFLKNFRGIIREQNYSFIEELIKK